MIFRSADGFFFVRLFGSVPATGHWERRESRGGREGGGQEVGVREGEPEFAPTRAPARLGDSTTGPGAPSMVMLQPGPKGRRGRLRVEKLNFPLGRLASGIGLSGYRVSGIGLSGIG